MIEKDQEEIYPCTFKYQDKEFTLLWATGGDMADHFLLMGDGALYKARGIQDAKKRFTNAPYKINWNEASKMDFDRFWSQIYQLSKDEATDQSTCKLILDGWNFIEDILRTFSLDELQGRLNDTQINQAYEKIYWGNNIGAVTPEGSAYSPLWEEGELLALQESLLFVWKGIGQNTELWRVGHDVV